MRLIAIQLISSDDVSMNLRQIEAALQQAKPEPNDLVLLPENFALMAQAEDYWNIAEALGQGEVQTWLSELAQRYRCFLVAGSFPIRSEQGLRCYTTALAYSPQGVLLAHYHKLHLFDVDVADKVGSYRESDSFVAGSELAYFEANGVKVGLAICFDLRFPYLFQLLRQQGCDIVVLPAAFTAVTGQAHWQPLLQARAIENQIYLVAANQGGQHNPQRQTWGHSMIVDPWGRCTESAAQGVSYAQAKFEPQKIMDLRASIPLRAHAHLSLKWREKD